MLAASGQTSREWKVRCCTRDEGKSLGVGNHLPVETARWAGGAMAKAVGIS